MEGIDDEYFKMDLKVVTDGLRALTQHPTFAPAKVMISPINNAAESQRLVWAAFAGGVTVAEEDTKSEKDLGELAAAPALFKSR